MAGNRNIALWYLLSIVTLGIASIVWYYKINADAKRLTDNNSWSPGLSVIAITLGAFVIVPPLVSIWKTWSRVREATNADGMNAGLQFLFCYVPLVSIAYCGYVQNKLNRAVPQQASAADAVPA